MRPSRTSTSRAASSALARIEHARAAHEQVGRRGRAADERVGQQLAHAGCGAAAGSRAGASTS